MPAIGASLRKWTLVLLLCSSILTPAYTQPTNETAIVDSHTTASSTALTLHTLSYTDPEALCPFRTINYITHTLPQQCAKTTWTAPDAVASTKGTNAETAVTPSTQATAHADNNAQDDKSSASTAVSQAQDAGSADTAVGSSTVSVDTETELETDSPLDKANFLSFEEWKNRNLAQVGQSPENVGQGRAAPSTQQTRRRPVNVNALDSLGEEAEIELDFTGFGGPLEGANIANRGQAASQDAGAQGAADGEKKPSPSSWARSKDAGKTCKERFNYASFDCAATVLKTNKQAKSATSVLVENKDSYMLNECSAGNKFLIVELCDDILIDTIVLANYEFFSSMFRHFRVSVSDRYPVKMERWRTLATFEARNARDIQPFLITEPQIWARYLRVEFLSQYGNEFYCPLSLLRVHGTTMMEQFRREEEEARGVDDDVDLEAIQADVVKPAIDSGPLPDDQLPIEPVKFDKEKSEVLANDATIQPVDSNHDSRQSISVEPPSQPSSVPAQTASSPPKSTEAQGGVGVSYVPPTQPTPTDNNSKDAAGATAVFQGNASADVVSTVKTGDGIPQETPASDPTMHSSTISDSKNVSRISQSVNDTVRTSSSAAVPKATGDSNVGNAFSQSYPRASPTQPNPAAPSTQESFFKALHKRLQYLEANSTLSLQYIEEQSRILRDAFIKVEKRQLVKTEKFLDHLNSTVMQELKSFRTMYDQLWQSTVIELESMKERQKNEMGEIGSRLSLMADELVWQKRMAVVQSTLLLLCLGLVLFVRSGTLGSTADVPIVRQLGSKYSSFFESSPPHSPPESGLARRRRTFRNMWRSDTSIGLSDQQSDGARSPVQIEYSPPTPGTPGAFAESDMRNGTRWSDEYASSTPQDDAKPLEVLETQSGPATPNGTRDSRPSWEEVDRAIDQLRAEEAGAPTARATKRERERKKKRSPLRRAQSSFDGAGAGD
ncbi:UNC-like C-terminal-domain-containing protein, partial [Phaeosphaeriaceae sp. PMI808]